MLKSFKYIITIASLICLFSCANTYVNVYNQADNNYKVNSDEVIFTFDSEINKVSSNKVGNFNISSYASIFYQDSLIKELKKMASNKGGNRIVIDTFKVSGWDGSIYASGNIYYSDKPKPDKKIYLIKYDKNLSELFHGLEYKYKDVTSKFLTDIVYVLDYSEALSNKLYFNDNLQEIASLDTTKGLIFSPGIYQPPTSGGGGFVISLNTSKKIELIRMSELEFYGNCSKFKRIEL